MRDYKPSEKQRNCRFALPYQGPMDNMCTYCLNGKTLGDMCDELIVSNDTCEKCQNYKSRHIEYPITVNKIEMNDSAEMISTRAGKFVKIRPCAEKYNNKTFLGLYLGNQPAFNSVSYNEDNGVLKVKPVLNPAIFVFELKKIIFGCESWWSIIENPEDIKNISDIDIDNVWYVKMLKAMSEATEDAEKGAKNEW